jgi:hypothetical protein
MKIPIVIVILAACLACCCGDDNAPRRMALPALSCVKLLKLYMLINSPKRFIILVSFYYEHQQRLGCSWRWLVSEAVGLLVRYMCILGLGLWPIRRDSVSIIRE